MTGAVYVPKGWRWERGIQPHDRDTILERLLLLPAWAIGADAAANLDVKALAGHQGFFRLRVGNFRAVFHRLKDQIILHLVDRRSDVYEGGAFEGLRFIRSGEGLRVLAEPPTEAPASPVTPHRPLARERANREEVANPLSPFTDKVLEGAGLSSETVAALRRLPTDLQPDETLARLGVDRDLTAMVAELWERPGHYLAALDQGATLGPALVALDEEEAAQRLASDDSATSLLAVTDAEAFAALLERPIEDWMVYLHPAQLRPVRLSAGGPSRVRGGAGTGKTVVALHRARHLAEVTGKRVLLTTFISTLPKVWPGLFATFAPDVRDLIDIRTVDSLADSIYSEGGGRFGPADQTALDALVRDLRGDRAGPIGGLSSIGLQEEFDYVLSGRGVEDLDAYLALPRTGRGSPLSATAREEVWALYERYRERLARAKRYDWHILRRAALDMLRAGEVAKDFGAVIVDEAQDLTETSVELLVAVAGGLPHPNLTVVGDGQQSIYPGGFSLRSLGVDVRGRSTVLRTNWRNTYAIWLVASALIAGETFDDLEDDDATLRPDAESPYPLRDGAPPRLHVIQGGPKDEAEWLAEVIAEDLQEGADPGGCAALVPTNAGVNGLEHALRAAGVPYESLTRYEGVAKPCVWVGTFHRAKGLEFKRVYIAGLAEGRWPALLKELDDAALDEARARQVRAAFVAMTRARDALDVVVAGEPGGPLAAASWAFDR